MGACYLDGMVGTPRAGEAVDSRSGNPVRGPIIAHGPRSKAYVRRPLQPLGMPHADAMHVRRLTPLNAAPYRAMMLQAYASEPSAFTATVPEREHLPIAWWTARVSDQPDAAQRVLGAFEDDRLAGVAGLRFGRRERTAHQASLFGVFVLPEFRRRGMGRVLVEAVGSPCSARHSDRPVRVH